MGGKGLGDQECHDVIGVINEQSLTVIFFSTFFKQKNYWTKIGENYKIQQRLQNKCAYLRLGVFWGPFRSLTKYLEMSKTA